MKKVLLSAFMFLVVTGLLFSNISCSSPTNDKPETEATNSETHNDSESIALPEPEIKGDMSLEAAIYSRISRREFADEALGEKEFSQLLWASQGVGVDGVTGASRTAPSAGATHPFNIYVIAGDIENMPAGVYRYNYESHDLTRIKENDYREEIASAALSQGFIAEAPAIIVLVADYSRTTGRYGERGEKYVHMEAGHIAQNIHLQAETLNMGTVVVGAFNDDKVKQIIQTEHAPLIIMPVGHLNIFQ